MSNQYKKSADVPVESLADELNKTANHIDSIYSEAARKLRSFSATVEMFDRDFKSSEGESKARLSQIIQQRETIRTLEYALNHAKRTIEELENQAGVTG